MIKPIHLLTSSPHQPSTWLRGCCLSEAPAASACGFSGQRSWRKVAGCLGRTRRYRVWINHFRFAPCLQSLTQWSLRRHVQVHTGLVSLLVLTLSRSLQHPN